MIQDIMDYLSQADPEVGASIQREFDREQHNIELALDVPAQTSSARSTSATRQRYRASSRAAAQPTTPPPTTITS